MNSEQVHRYLDSFHRDGLNLGDGSGDVEYWRFDVLFYTDRRPEHLDGSVHLRHLRLQAKSLSSCGSQVQKKVFPRNQPQAKESTWNGRC